MINREDRVQSRIKRSELEMMEKWDYWVDAIPSLQLKPEWKVKIIPPFSGAMARFWIHFDGMTTSVYLDTYDRLGSVGEPYWEVHPYDDDVYRVSMNDTDELIQRIEESFEQRS